MKLLEQERFVKVNGADAPKKFGIIFNAKMARILSDQLYADKISAVIRELSTNALDSHIANGNSEESFDVHFPQWNNLEFYVRDYGTGMSQETLENLYSTYGGSDKDQSNNFTGCLGLGSKTPFCYNTRTFTVESYYDGQKHVYSCFLDAAGEPNLVHAFSGPTDERSGLKVSFPVKENDCYDFQNKAVRVYKYFAVKPNMVGHKLELESQEYFSKTKDWGIREDDEYGDANAIMGNVRYPIDSAHFKGDLAEVLDMPIDLFFDMGELDFAPSREGLSYIPQTINAIKRRLRQVHDELLQMVQDKIDGSTSLWDARLAYAKSWDTIPNAVFKKVDWKCVEWNSHKLFDGLAPGRVNIKDLRDAGGLEVCEYSPNRWRKTPSHSETQYVQCKTDIIFIEDDIKRGGKSRVKQYVTTEQKTVLFCKFNNDAVRQNFLNTLGMSDDSVFVKASTLPPTTNGGGNRGGYRNSRGAVSTAVFCASDFETKNRYWEDCEVDFDDGGYYVLMNRWDAGPIDTHKFSNVVKALKKAGVAVPTIYGIRKPLLKDVVQDDDWIDFISWAKEQLENAASKINCDLCLHAKKQIDSIGYKYSWREDKNRKMEIEDILFVADKCNDDDILTEFAEQIREYEKYSENVSAIYAMKEAKVTLNIADKIFNCDSFDKVDLFQMEKDVYKRYPLLHSIRGESVKKNPNVLEHLGLYVTMVAEG